MWLSASVFSAAFLGNIGAEILAESVSDLFVEVYANWFWSVGSEQTMLDAARQYDQIDILISNAERGIFDVVPPSGLEQR